MPVTIEPVRSGEGVHIRVRGPPGYDYGGVEPRQLGGPAPEHAEPFHRIDIKRAVPRRRAPSLIDSPQRYRTRKNARGERDGIWIGVVNLGVPQDLEARLRENAEASWIWWGGCGVAILHPGEGLRLGSQCRRCGKDGEQRERCGDRDEQPDGDRK